MIEHSIIEFKEIPITRDFVDSIVMFVYRNSIIFNE